MGWVLVATGGEAGFAQVSPVMPDRETAWAEMEAQVALAELELGPGFEADWEQDASGGTSAASIEVGGERWTWSIHRLYEAT